MLYLACTMIASVDFACYRLSGAEDLRICGLWYKDPVGMANSVEPDQTAPWSSLIWVCTVCSDLSVPIFCGTMNCSNLAYFKFHKF